LLKDDIVLGTALIDMYAKCGDLRRASRLFDELPQRDVVSWSAILAGYSQLGQVDMVLDTLRRMRAVNVQPNAVTFVVLLNACSHAGLLEHGEMLFRDMVSLHRISPTADHFSCMVDLFGRAGALEKAKRFLLPDVAVLLAFLGACRKWGELELGRSAFERIVRLDRKCANAYVCMENLYASSICEDAKQRLMIERNAGEGEIESEPQDVKIGMAFCVDAAEGSK
jgi:pentatricopeptide repeat protein